MPKPAALEMIPPAVDAVDRLEAWDMVAPMLDRYLQVLGVTQKHHLDKARLRLRERLADKPHGDGELLECALHELQQWLDEWLERVLIHHGLGGRADLPTAHAALLNGAIAEWPQHWLEDDMRIGAPAAFRSAFFSATPEPSGLAMPTQPIVLASERLRGFCRRRFGRLFGLRRKKGERDVEGEVSHSKTPFGYRLQRYVYFALVAVTTGIAITILGSVFENQGMRPLELLLLILYAVLFTWICASFWTAVLGFLVLLIKRDRYAIKNLSSIPSDNERLDAACKTALVMPVYNEEPARIFAGLRAIYQSLVEIGAQDHFEIFILSDTRDPDLWVEEELRWRQLCRDCQAEGRIFYRNRVQNTARKSGNIADFCRNWGDRYRYMVVLDADSLMSGSTLVEMVKRMEKNPEVGLIQVTPIPANHNSLFARILQFAGSLYGPMFTAGLNFWQLGESNFWGHNAIIRVKAFAAHCGLPSLPGEEPFGGEILSHDFVEAALLRRAGWKIWLAYDLAGSYEELPTNLLDYAKRDRRWCQGNLQHSRLIFARGFHPMNRLHFAMGVMSYLASPLWLLFLIITAVEAYIQAREIPVYFFGQTLFPIWPTSYKFEMMTVLLVTLVFLFVPKLLAYLLLLFRSSLRKQYGGALRAGLSVLLESLFATLIAPVMMLFHTKFVSAILLRRNIGWPAQQRGDHGTGFKEAVKGHAGHTLLGIGAGAASFWYVPEYFWWFIPVMVGLLLCIPISVICSRIGLGRMTRRLGLFVTPAETKTPRIIELLNEYLAESKQQPLQEVDKLCPWCQAFVDPYINALHSALQPAGQPLSRRQRYYLEGLIYQLDEEGPEALNVSERRALLSHPGMLAKLHAFVWGTRPIWAVPLLEITRRHLGGEMMEWPCDLALGMGQKAAWRVID